MPGVATMLLPPILTRFCRQYPDISLEVENRPRLQVMDWLNSQQYDFGFANLPLEVDDVRIHSTVDMDLVIYNQIYFLQEMWILLGWCLTVKNWWCHLSQHLGINATNYFMY